MNNTLQYKGYVGTVEFSQEDKLFYGKVSGIKALLSYEGATADELLTDFKGVIDDYLMMCEENGIAPERQYKGSFNVRISPELHKEAVLYSLAHGISLNSFVEEALRSTLRAK